VRSQPIAVCAARRRGYTEPARIGEHSDGLAPFVCAQDVMCFVNRPVVNLRSPRFERVGTRHQRIDAGDRAVGVRIDERPTAKLAPMFCNDLRYGCLGTNDSMLDTAPGDMKAHLANEFFAVRNHALFGTGLVAIQHDIGHDHRLAATGRQDGKHVAVPGVPTGVHGLFECGLIGA
jgi:hypothetical protein